MSHLSHIAVLCARLSVLISLLLGAGRSIYGHLLAYYPALCSPLKVVPVDGGNGVQKWQGLDPMIGIRATGIYTTLRNAAGMEPQSIGGARVG